MQARRESGTVTVPVPHLINASLREHITARRETLETTLRRVIREELPKRVAREWGRGRRRSSSTNHWPACVKAAPSSAAQEVRRPSFLEDPPDQKL